MPLQTCLVHFTDFAGTRHTAEVTAESLFEAAALAFKAFAQSPFVEQTPGIGSRFEVEVTAPKVVHTVTVHQVRKWVESGSSDPRESAKKARLAEILGSNA